MIDEKTGFNILAETPSCPIGLFGSKDWTTFNIFSQLKLRSFTLLFVYVGIDGRMLSFDDGWHW